MPVLKLKEVTIVEKTEANYLQCLFEKDHVATVVDVKIVVSGDSCIIQMDHLLEPLFNGNIDALSKMRQWLLYSLSGMPLPSSVEVHLA